MSDKSSAYHTKFAQPQARQLHSQHTREAVSAPRENITTEEAATETPSIVAPSDSDDSVDRSSSVIVIIITITNILF